MASATRICKVCGKEYKYCRTFLPTAFRWQDVACCMEHAQEYFARIDAVRNENTNDKDVELEKENVADNEELDIYLDEEDDENEDDWFSDDDEADDDDWFSDDEDGY